MMTTNNNRAPEDARKTGAAFFMIFLWQFRFQRNELKTTVERDNLGRLNSMDKNSTLFASESVRQTQAAR